VESMPIDSSSPGTPLAMALLPIRPHPLCR
jgi:hypothetical protein